MLFPNSDSNSSITSNVSQNRSQALQNTKSGKRGNGQVNYFRKVLSQAGVTLSKGDDLYIINQEQALVTRDINNILQNDEIYPNNLKQFISGLEVWCQDETNFKGALGRTELQKDSDTPDDINFAAMKLQQDSLIRILLNVSCIQTEVINILMEHVTNTTAEVAEDTRWLRMLLNPLRYLSHINDSKLLSTKLLDTLEITSYTAQLDILNLIPEIIPDNEYENTAEQLHKLLEDNIELTGAIIDCMNCLNLKSDIRSEIQQQILAKLEGTPPKVFPVLLEFLITDCQGASLHSVLIKIRNSIDTIMSRESNHESDSYKVIIFNKLQTFAVVRKSLSEAWINVISKIHSSSDHKPIDLLILFMLYSVAKVRKPIIKAVFKRRIKSGMFKMSLFEVLFKKYFVPQILKDYLPSIIEIAASLLRFHNDHILVEFASLIFKLIFHHKLIDRVQRRDIIYNLIFLTNTSEKKSVTSALNILSSFLEDKEKLQQNTVQLMGLLEKLDVINLKDVKLIFEILCNLTCGTNADDSTSGFKDEIHMIIRKLLSSYKKIVKHRGIIAAVVMAKILARYSEDDSKVLLKDPISIEDLREGGPQEAAALLHLTNSCTLGSPDSAGLYYDELTNMLITSELNKNFVLWLSNILTNDFQIIFVVDNVPNAINNIPFSMQYSLNAAEEVNGPISINIAELSMKSQFYQNNSILILAPMFRLLRNIYHQSNDGDLAAIDALLGCAVIMPNLEDVDSYDNEQLKQVVDCTFHCINWFRETINAFITKKPKNLRRKVIERLANVIELEDKLRQLLKVIPDHQLPVSYFDTQSQSSKQLSPAKAVKVTRPTKKQKLAEGTSTMNDSTTSLLATQPIKSTTIVKKKETNIESNFTFREMDIDIILLLRYPLNLVNNLNITLSQIGTQTRTLTIKQFKFIVKDFVKKLTILTKNEEPGIVRGIYVTVVEFIKDCIRILPLIKKHLNTITLQLDNLLKELDEFVDSKKLFTAEANELKTCFALIMKCYALVFGWSGFQHTKHLNLLRDCLKSLLTDHESQLISIKAVITSFTGTLLQNVNYCLYLPAAVNLVEVMQGLYETNPNPELKKQIIIVSGKLLTKRWYNLNGDVDTGKNAFININILVKSYLNGANVKTLSGLVGTLQEQITSIKTKEDKLPMLASIDKTNFYIFYRCLCMELLSAVKNEITSLTNNEHLVLWKTTGLTMQGLMMIVKVQQTKTNLISFIKNSTAILKVFLASGIPILEIMLRSKCDQVVEIFKIMQTSTRFLHYLCCHSKFTKNTSLVAYVPQFRFTLESLLYRVKAALVANGCSEAFWMGTLKNKDLNGEDILSQSTIQTEESTDIASDNEELPPDDSEEEMDVEDVGTSDIDSLSSEVY